MRRGRESVGDVVVLLQDGRVRRGGVGSDEKRREERRERDGDGDKEEGGRAYWEDGRSESESEGGREDEDEDGMGTKRLRVNGRRGQAAQTRQASADREEESASQTLRHGP